MDVQGLLAIAGPFIDRFGLPTVVVLVLCRFMYLLLAQNTSMTTRLFAIHADQFKSQKDNIEAIMANTASNDRLAAKIDKFAGCQAGALLSNQAIQVAGTNSKISETK